MMHASSAMTTTWRGVLSGLVPLALLSILVALTLALTMLARQLSASQGLLVEQPVVGAVLGIGLVVTASVYAIACARALRLVGKWQRAGDGGPAAGALWALGLTAFLVFLPVLLVVALP